MATECDRCADWQRMGLSDTCPSCDLAEEMLLEEKGKRMSKTGIELIAEERGRQISEEGWTPEHDAEHTDGSLALAAVCYATPIRLFRQDLRQDQVLFTDPWTWHSRWDKRPRNQHGELYNNEDVDTEKRIRQLQKAGALIAAEIDRLQAWNEENKESK